MHDNPSAEAHVIELLRARDPDGLAAAYDLYASTAFALVIRITRDKVVAEDILQELFLRLWIHGRKFDSTRGTLRAWVLSIARHLAIDYMRSAQRRLSGQLYTTSSVEALCSVIDPITPDTRITNVETVREIFAALGAEEKRIIELAYFEGFSQTEIAERLQQPLGTVKSRMRSALQRLRAAVTGSAES